MNLIVFIISLFLINGATASTCVDDDASAIAALSQMGLTISGCADVASQCSANTQIASLCCATCSTSTDYFIAYGNPANGGVSTASDDETHPVRCVSDTSISGWMSKCGIWFESDIWGSCQEMTYANAVQFCAQFGARLPTVVEVQNDCVSGSGCSFNSRQIWTSDVATGDCFEQIVDAKRGTITSPFEIVDNEYVEAPEGTGNNQGGELSFDFVCFNAIDNLQFRAETRSPLGGNDDSFWEVLDGGEAIRWDVRSDDGTDWTWGELTSVYSVSAGFHTFTIRNREDGTQIRSLKIVNNAFPDCKLVASDYDCPNSCDFMTAGGAEELCDIADSEWHSSIDPSADGCAARVWTGGNNCETWCQSVGSHCVYAQDNDGATCSLYSDHERQSTFNNGCTQEWNSQVCVCAIPGTGSAYVMTDDNNDNIPDIRCSSVGDCAAFLDTPEAAQLATFFEDAGGVRCKNNYCIPVDASLEGESCMKNDQCVEPGMTCIPYSSGLDMKCGEPRGHNNFCLQHEDCDTDYGCKGGFCSMGHNGDWCGGDGDCDSDHYCEWLTVYATCQDKVSNGNPCGWDSVCQSGDCAWYFFCVSGRRELEEVEFRDVRSSIKPLHSEPTRIKLDSEELISNDNASRRKL
jgi:hypothetical protein